jgi:putative pyruvate formate lyase activating enzyme
MPNGVANTMKIVEFLAKKISKNTYVNVMDQYHPCGKAMWDPMMNRRINRSEYAEAVRFARGAGLYRLDSRL